MRNIIKNLAKQVSLFGIGGVVYILLEELFRGHTHWTMFIVGGICFFLIGLINEIFPWSYPVWKQCGIGAIIVTVVEFCSGCIINLYLKWNVWDYSGLPFNVLGQICLPFTMLWFALSFVAILLDDWIRWKYFEEEKPTYNWGWK